MSSFDLLTAGCHTLGSVSLPKFCCLHLKMPAAFSQKFEAELGQLHVEHDGVGAELARKRVRAQHGMLSPTAVAGMLAAQH